eukprot:TRINITY_DN4111_c0_g1_i2.p1 TRINITY_DN4111_c0_g1~~TRINITY_DN4111_c0_g1_i2.p1  ORF type:complete len:872 (-),score=148.12 TRINITY_DN4111_c0_g1_i2:141-2756(-)
MELRICIASVLLFLLLFILGADAQTWNEQTALLASDASSTNEFGWSVAITDNYALVGSRFSDPNSVSNAGAAYIFSRSSAGWNQQAILTASNKAADDRFGHCVAITNQYAIATSVHADFVTATDAGAAYIFIRTNSTWTEHAILTALNKEPDSYFGVSLAMTNNFAIVGAHGTNYGAADYVGSAFIFSRSGTTWTQQALFTAGSNAQLDQYAYAVSLTDLHAVVGRPTGVNTNQATSPGAAFVYTVSGGTWALSATLSASNFAVGDFFGTVVSISTNYLLVGAANQYHIYSRSGSSWLQQQTIDIASSEKDAAITEYYALILSKIYVRSENNWTLQSTLSRSSTAVALTDSYLILGNSGASPNGWTSAGEAYIFVNSVTRSFTQSISKSHSRSRSRSRSKSHSRSRSQSRSKSQSKSRSRSKSQSRSRSQSKSQTWSSSRSQSYSQSQSRSRSKSRSKSQTRSRSRSQSASQSPGPQLAGYTIHSLSRPTNNTFIYFASTVLVHENRILASTPYCPPGISICRGGRVFVLEKQQGQSPILLRQTINFRGIPNTATGFGQSMAAQGNWLIISSANAQFAGSTDGVVFVFSWSSATQKYVKNSSVRPRLLQNNLMFGFSIGLNDTYIAVGAPGYSQPPAYVGVGAVLFFPLRNGIWSKYGTLYSSPISQGNQYFGASLACAEGLVAVGNRPQDTSFETVSVMRRESKRSWIFVQQLQQPGRAGFGWSISMFATTLVATARLDASVAGSQGSAIVFQANATGLFEQIKTLLPTDLASESMNFGFASSIAETRIVIGTNACGGADCNQKGGIYSFTKAASGTWDFEFVQAIGEAQGTDMFGTSVACNDQRIVVGAPRGLVSGSRVGKMYVFDALA